MNIKNIFTISLIVLLLTIIISNNIHCAYASVIWYNGTVTESGYVTNDGPMYDQDTGYINFLTQTLWYNSFAETGIPLYIYYTEVYVFAQTGINWNDIPNVVGGSFTLYDHDTAQFAGTGSIHFFKSSLDSNRLAQLRYEFNEDFIPKEGGGFYDLSIAGTALNYWYKTQELKRCSNQPYITYIKDECNFHFDLNAGYDPGQMQTNDMVNSVGAKYYCKNQIDFKNQYAIKLFGSTSTANIYRNFPGFQTASRFVLKNDTDSLIYQSSYSSSNGTYYQDNGSYKYYIQAQNSETLFKILDMTIEDEEEEEEHTVLFTLSSNNYTYPENISVSYEIENSDFSKYTYIIQTLYEYSNDNWNIQGCSYNKSVILNSDTGTFLISPITQIEKLPRTMKITIKAYEKSLGSEFYKYIGYSNEFVYNPPSEFDYILYGYVFDTDTENVIPNALVRFSGLFYDEYEVYTNILGYYEVGVMENYYSPLVYKSGYYNYTSNVFYANSNKRIDFGLTPISITNGTLQGTIKDTNNNLLENVYIYLHNDTYYNGAYSDENGFYKMIGLAQNTTYNIIISKSGFYSIDDIVTTELSGGTVKDFVMVSKTIEPTPTPTYPIDEEIENQVDELKDSIEPLKQLVFGISEIFIDNPDYNDDNIVSESEINIWLGSIISLVLVIFLLVMYFGLKDRNKRY